LRFFASLRIDKSGVQNDRIKRFLIKSNVPDLVLNKVKDPERAHCLAAPKEPVLNEVKESPDPFDPKEVPRYFIDGIA